MFRQVVDTAFYDKCFKNHRLKAVEQKKKTAAANVGGQVSTSAPKTQMVKQPTTTSASTAVATTNTTAAASADAPSSATQSAQQQGQLRRTHSEGDGAERAKNRSNALDKATESTMETPLTIACANGHHEIVDLLIKEGANIEHRDKKGFSPLIIASTAGHASVVEILLKNHAAIEAQSDRTKDTALSLACSGGRKEVVELLITHNANKEHRNVSDYTPLALASSGGFIDIVNMLIAAGAEINSRTGSKLGISPLMLSSMNGHKDATRVLLEKGSDINAQIETNKNTALTLASFQGRSEVVKLLLHFNANVEHRAKTGLTPLMECATGGYVENTKPANGRQEKSSTTTHYSSKATSSGAGSGTGRGYGSGGGGDDRGDPSKSQILPEDCKGMDDLEVEEFVKVFRKMTEQETVDFFAFLTAERFNKRVKTRAELTNTDRLYWLLFQSQFRRLSIKEKGSVQFYCPICMIPSSMGGIINHVKSHKTRCYICLLNTHPSHTCNTNY